MDHMTDAEWTEECYLTHDGRRMCFHVSGALVQVPRTILDGWVEHYDWTPTAAPGEESPAARGPHNLKRPVMLEEHAHSWRMSSATHNGAWVYQCRICEATAIEGAPA